MIYGNIKYLNRYAGMLTGPVWAEAFSAISRLTEASPLGIQSLRGEDMYINIHAYATKPRERCRFESHRHTIDLQYVISGGEFIDYADTAALKPAGDYMPEKEVQFYEPFASDASISLEAGWWAIFFPEDAHRPQINNPKHENILKAVVKIPVKYLEGL